MKTKSLVAFLSLALCCASSARAQTLEWVRQLGTSSSEGSHGVSADGLGNVYISGRTHGSLGGPNAGYTDAFVARLSDPLLALIGDYDGNGQVEQGDLNLVLFHWGADTEITGVPAGWVNRLPNSPDRLTAVIDQEDLDTVLLSWGGTASVAVPEPVALPIWELLCGFVVAIRRRGFFAANSSCFFCRRSARA